jgi:hypothetical protein
VLNLAVGRQLRPTRGRPPRRGSSASQSFVTLTAALPRHPAPPERRPLSLRVKPTP